MLSDVIGNILNSHMTLYLNIMKAQDFYILFKLKTDEALFPQGSSSMNLKINVLV